MAILHKNSVASENHHPFSFVFEDENQRLLAAVTTADLYKFAIQSSNNTVWWLVNVNPNTWVNILLQGAKTTPIGPAGGDLTGSYPNPTVSDNSHEHTPGVTIPAYPTALPPTGVAGGDLVGNLPNPSLVNTSVTAGTYDLATVTVDSKGRVTSATSNTIPVVSFDNVSLTGNPTAPDVAYGDNSTKLANTKFVNNSIQAEILEEGTSLTISLNYQKTISRRYVVKGTLINRGKLFIDDTASINLVRNTVPKLSKLNIPIGFHKLTTSPYVVNGIIEVYGQLRLF